MERTNAFMAMKSTTENATNESIESSYAIFMSINYFCVNGLLMDKDFSNANIAYTQFTPHCES